MSQFKTINWQGNNKGILLTTPCEVDEKHVFLIVIEDYGILGSLADLICLQLLTAMH